MQWRQPEGVYTKTHTRRAVLDDCDDGIDQIRCELFVGADRTCQIPCVKSHVEDPELYELAPVISLRDDRRAASTQSTNGTSRMSTGSPSTRPGPAWSPSATSPPPHTRAYMVDLTATTSSLDPWYYQPLSNRCLAASAYAAYLRGVDFAPDGQHFEIAATGYVVADSTGINRDICDAVARFPTTHNPSPQTPRTGSTTPAGTPCTASWTPARWSTSTATTGGWTTPTAKTPAAPTCSPGAAPDPGSAPSTRRPGTHWPGVRAKPAASVAKTYSAPHRGCGSPPTGQHIAGEYHYGIAFMPLATS